MATIRLSNKGRLVLPKSIRAAQNLQPGTEFAVEDTPDGVLLRPLSPFPPTRVEDVFGSANYSGPVLTLEQMDAAVAIGSKRHVRR